MSETAFVGNPLTAFKAPPGLRRADIEGGFFQTRREEVVNERYGMSIYPNDFKYLPDPTLEIDFKLWEDYETSDMRAFHTYNKLTMREGYQVALAKDFDVNNRIALTWKADAAGRLTAGGRATNTLVLMWCTGEKRRELDEEALKWSNDIQKHAESEQDRIQANLGRAGINGYAQASVTDDDGRPENAPTQPILKKKSVALSGAPLPKKE